MHRCTRLESLEDDKQGYLETTGRTLAEAKLRKRERRDRNLRSSRRSPMARPSLRKRPVSIRTCACSISAWPRSTKNDGCRSDLAVFPRTRPRLRGLRNQLDVRHGREQFRERRSRERRIVGDEKTTDGRFVLCHRIERLENERLAEALEQPLHIVLAIHPYSTKIAIRSNPDTERPH